MSPSYSWQFEIISWQFLLCVHRQMERKILFQRRNERVLMKKMAAKKKVMKIPITKVLQMVTKTVFLYHFGAFVFLVVPYISFIFVLFTSIRNYKSKMADYNPCSKTNSLVPPVETYQHGHLQEFL